MVFVAAVRVHISGRRAVPVQRFAVLPGATFVASSLSMGVAAALELNFIVGGLDPPTSRLPRARGRFARLLAAFRGRSAMALVRICHNAPFGETGGYG